MYMLSIPLSSFISTSPPAWICKLTWWTLNVSSSRTEFCWYDKGIYQQHFIISQISGGLGSFKVPSHGSSCNWVISGLSSPAYASSRLPSFFPLISTFLPHVKMTESLLASLSGFRWFFSISETHLVLKKGKPSGLSLHPGATTWSGFPHSPWGKTEQNDGFCQGTHARQGPKWYRAASFSCSDHHCDTLTMA